MRAGDGGETEDRMTRLMQGVLLAGLILCGLAGGTGEKFIAGTCIAAWVTAVVVRRRLQARRLRLLQREALGRDIAAYMRCMREQAGSEEKWCEIAAKWGVDPGTVEEGDVEALAREAGIEYVPAVFPELVWVEGGIFQMGAGEADRGEGPAHDVEVESFYIGKYQVTCREYGAFCTATGRRDPCHRHWRGTNFPVVNVSWYDAVAYCNWLSEREGRDPCYRVEGEMVICDFDKDGYRLPTEAEWEYAARGGGESGGYRYAGSNNPDEVGWYRDNAGGRPHPVGGKKPNELGIYDMSGNVWEWCWDWYDEEYYEKAVWENPRGPAFGKCRVVRGGGWSGFALSMRTADRSREDPSCGLDCVGFRVARSP